MGASEGGLGLHHLGLHQEELGKATRMTVITQIDTDATQSQEAGIAQGLRQIASDAAILRMKLQALRWAYAGARRRDVAALLAAREHEMTGLFDVAATRLRTRGHPVPAGPGACRTHASIGLDDVSRDQETRLRALRDDLASLVAGCRATHGLVAARDVDTAARLAGQIRALERGLWMLSAQAAGTDR